MDSREALGLALADAMGRGNPGLAVPARLPLSPGRLPGRGDWVCAYCRQAGADGQTIALRTVLNLELGRTRLRLARAEDGFINLYLSDGWYLETLVRLQEVQLPDFALPQEENAGQRFVRLAADAGRLAKDWQLRRDRENPLYAVRYAAHRARTLAARTGSVPVAMTPECRRLVRELDACAHAATPQALLAALRSAAERFRLVYEEQKPDLPSGMLTKAVAVVLRQGLLALGFAEKPR